MSKNDASRTDISVIVPVYNGEPYIAEALGSILGQTTLCLEVIVVDDGSTDRTADVIHAVSDSRIRYTRRSRGGAGAARNTGIGLARGDLFAFLDADDRWTPHKLSLQSGLLRDHPDLGMVLGHYTEFISPELANSDLKTSQEPLPGYSIGTLMIRREAFFRAGLFSTQWRVGEFIEWYARAVDCGLTGQMMPQTVLERRVHSANTGIRDRAARADYARVVHAITTRRRAERAWTAT